MRSLCDAFCGLGEEVSESRGCVDAFASAELVLPEVGGVYESVNPPFYYFPFFVFHHSHLFCLPSLFKSI